MKKILILGANGFIGKNLIEKLNLYKYEIVAFDLFFDNKINQNNIKYIEKDFFSIQDYNEILNGIDIVIYLITTITPFNSMHEKKLEGYTKDLIAANKFIECTYRKGISRIIFASSGGTIYGEQLSERISEKFYCSPLNHYGIIKLTIENILKMYNKVYGMNNISLRIANPYGSGQDNSKKVGVIPIFIEKILRGEEIVIYGDGNIVRDFINIEDVIEAFIKAIEYDGMVDTFNIGTGIGTSLNEIIEILSNKLKLIPKIKYIKEREMDVQKNILDNTLMKKLLEIENIFSIEKGIEELIEKEIGL